MARKRRSDAAPEGTWSLTEMLADDPRATEALAELRQVTTIEERAAWLDRHFWLLLPPVDD